DHQTLLVVCARRCGAFLSSRSQLDFRKAANGGYTFTSPHARIPLAAADPGRRRAFLLSPLAGPLPRGSVHRLGELVRGTLGSAAYRPGTDRLLHLLHLGRPHPREPGPGSASST